MRSPLSKISIVAPPEMASDRFRLEGHVAVVTGAQGRLGPVWAQALLEAGARVYAVDRPGAQPSAALSRLSDRFGMERVASGTADVRDRQALESVLAACTERFGTPDVLVNNAGVDFPPEEGTPSWPVEEIPLDRMAALLEVNVLGAFQCAQVVGGAMIRAKRGSIVNIGSVYASVVPDPALYEHLRRDPPFVKMPAYGASKSALVNLTRQLAVHWAPYNVRVNALSPGGVSGGQDPEFKRKFSQRTPLGRLAEPSDLAGPLVFLASDASSYVTGAELKVDGGFTLL